MILTMYQLWQSTDVGVRSTAQVVDTLVSHFPEVRAKGLSGTGVGSQGVTKPRVPLFAVKAKKVRYLSFHQVWLVHV
jgi:hypothetical protein